MRRLVLLPLLLAFLLPGAPALAEEPKSRATFGIQPATAKGPDGRPYLLYPVAPGASVNDHVAVVNLSRTPLTLRVYATDAFNGADGAFSLLARDEKPRDAGTWLRVGTPASTLVTVRPRSFTVVPVRLSVPANASPGDHVAGIVAALSTRSDNEAGTNVELDQRVGIRSFVRVSGELRPRLSIENLRASYSGTWAPLGRGRTTIEYDVRNTGNVSLGGAQRVSAHGLVGPTFAGRDVADLPLLVPGGSTHVIAEVPRTWPLVWMTGRVDIDPAVVVGVGSGNVPDFAATTRFWAVPWTLLALLLLAVVTWRVWRRLSRALPDTGPKHVRPKAPAGAAARVATALAVLTAPLLPTTAEAAEAPPYTDPAVTGTIALCDVQGRNVLSGKVTDKPFVWKAVGSSAATAPYDAPGRTAFLAAYQPREGIAPGDWSGYQLAAASRYDTVAHPTSQSTPLSSSLQDFLGRYPAYWKGTVQLRLVLAGANRSPRLTEYDATDLQVDGDTWRVVRGGTGSCGAGKATSTSVLLGLPGASGTPKPGAVASPPPVREAPQPQVTDATTGPVAQTPAAASKGVAAGSLTALVVGGLAVAAVASGLTVWAVRRRDAG